MTKISVMFALLLLLHSVSARDEVHADSLDHPLSKINILAATKGQGKATIEVSPSALGASGESSEFVNVDFSFEAPTKDDWVGVFSPANFREGCEELNPRAGGDAPIVCRAPVKFQFCNFKNPDYEKTGKGKLRLQIRNQRSDFSFVLFTGGLSNPQLLAVSSVAAFADPKAPLYPRLAQGREFNEMTVTWTSGYGVDEAEPFVEFEPEGGFSMVAPAGTLTFDRRSMCGAPARTVGWRDPGFIHTCSMKNLFPNKRYSYRMAHKLSDGTFVYSQKYSFRASPCPGQSSVQRIALFGALGKGEVDGSTEMDDYQPGSLQTTNQLIKDVDNNNIDMVFHLGDLSCAKGYLSQWDHFTQQIEPIASRVPYMVASGNRDREYPDSRSFYNTDDSGGECGVAAESMFYVPSERRASFRYATDFGMFRFCVADTSQDWRKGSEQYEFLERCFASADRRKQPWLVFLAHRVLGYSSEKNYALQGSFGEPMGRGALQELMQKYKVDLAMFGHAHQYERTCALYQDKCNNKERKNFEGNLNGTINVVVGGGGSRLSEFTELETRWSVRRDRNFGFGKLTAFNESSLLFEYRRSSDGEVFDSFTINREYRDILACSFDSCPRTTLASCGCASCAC